MKSYTIAIGSDHAGVVLKQDIIAHLEFIGHSVLDMGTNSEESVDYPDFGYAVAREVIEGNADYGIVICGSGIGISIAANRFAEIRAALCQNPEMAVLARQHNNANVLALGARFIDRNTALSCVDTFLTTDFEGGRHLKRVDKLSHP